MGHGVGHVEKEGPVLVLPDEADRPRRVETGQAVLVGRRPDPVDRLIALDERRIGVAELAGVRPDRPAVVSDRPHVVRIGQPEVLVETVLEGQELAKVAEVPLAEDAARVALLAEELGDGFSPAGEAVRRPGHQGVEDGDAVRIAAREEGGAGGAADGLGDVKAGEPEALGGHAVDMRGVDVGRSVAPEVAVAQVVGQDDDDVRRALAAEEAAGRKPQSGGAGAQGFQEIAARGPGAHVPPEPLDAGPSRAGKGNSFEGRRAPAMNRSSSATARRFPAATSLVSARSDSRS